MTNPAIAVSGLIALGIAVTQAPATDRSLGALEGTLSPNGQLVSYFDTTGPDLRVDRLANGQTEARVPVSGYIGSSAVSWDGRAVAFSSGIRGLGPGLRVLALPPAKESSPRLLIKGRDIDPVEWSRDGTQILATADVSPFDIRLVNVADGTFRILKTMSPASSLRYLALSPDGSLLAYDHRVAGAGRTRAVSLLPTKGGDEVPLLEPTAWHSVIGWSPDGRELMVFSDRDGFQGLWALPVRDGQAAGTLRLVKRDLDGHPTAVTVNGDVVYKRVSGPPAARLVTARIDNEGRVESGPDHYPVRDPLAFARFPRWSRDGKLFMYVTARLLSPALVIHSTSTHESRELTLPFQAFFSFDWARDGRSIIFKAVDYDNRVGMSALDITTGHVRTFKAGAVFYHPQYSQDGRRVSYFTRQGQTPQPVTWSYVEQDVESGEARPLIADLTALMANPRSYPAGRSPDGRYLLAVIIGPVSKLLAYDMTTGDTKEIHSAPGTEAFNHYGDIQWTSDSRSIITTVAATLHEDGNEQEIWWIPMDGRAARKIDVGTTLIGENPIAIHPDGRQIAFLAGRPFNATLPFSVSPAFVGAAIEVRLLGNVFGPR